METCFSGVCDDSYVERVEELNLLYFISSNSSMEFIMVTRFAVLPGANGKPFTPSFINSFSAPVEAAITGVPWAIASITTSGWFSYHIEGTTR